MLNLICRKCGLEQPISEYGKDKKSVSGYDNRCKTCERKRYVEYRKNNPEKVRESQRRFNQTEKRKQYLKVWSKTPEAKEIQARFKQKHPNATKEASKRYYHKNAKKENLRTIQYRAKNIERTRKHALAYYYRNRDDIKIRMASWQKDNKEKICEYQAKRRVKFVGNGVYKISKRDFKRLTSGYCAVCGSADNIQIDHIIPVSKGGHHAIGNLQLLCACCNRSKRDKTMTEWRYKKCI
jgi:5-methylcytosine-specific restriction endonuclease McrA